MGRSRGRDGHFQVRIRNGQSTVGGPKWTSSVEKLLGSDFGRTDFSRIFIFGPPDFFVDFVAGFFLLIFVGKNLPHLPVGKTFLRFLPCVTWLN